MAWYLIVTLISLSVSFIAFLYHVIRLIRYGKPRDFSKPAGNLGNAMVYSFTGSMSPAKKESAFLHLPTYTAGVVYHLGTFLSFALFFIFVFKIGLDREIKYFLSVFLSVSVFCGIGILLKRIFSYELRELSNPDDYISNILVTGFQVFTILFLYFSTIGYFLIFSLLLIHIPLGKLKHLYYFFAARYHLGLFYGWRGTWPPQKIYREKS